MKAVTLPGSRHVKGYVDWLKTLTHSLSETITRLHWGRIWNRRLFISTPQCLSGDPISISTQLLMFVHKLFFSGKDPKYGSSSQSMSFMAAASHTCRVIEPLSRLSLWLLWVLHYGPLLVSWPILRYCYAMHEWVQAKCSRTYLHVWIV